MRTPSLREQLIADIEWRIDNTVDDPEIRNILNLLLRLIRWED